MFALFRSAMCLITGIAAFASLAAAPAAALPTTLSFSVQLDTGQPKPPGINDGDTLTGTIVYDLAEIATQLNGAFTSNYTFNAGTASFSFTVGSGVSTYAQSNFLGSIQVTNANHDAIEFFTQIPGTQTQWSLTLVDDSAALWSTNFLENIPVTTIADLGPFSDEMNDIRTFVFGDFLPGGYRLSGEVIAFSVVQEMPEPASAGLVALGLAGLGVATRRRKAA